jgi:hypothetical protein
MGWLRYWNTSIARILLPKCTGPPNRMRTPGRTSWTMNAASNYRQELRNGQLPDASTIHPVHINIRSSLGFQGYSWTTTQCSEEAALLTFGRAFSIFKQALKMKRIVAKEWKGYERHMSTVLKRTSYTPWYCPQITSWSLRGVNVLSEVRGEYRACRWTEDFLLVSDKET